MRRRMTTIAWTGALATMTVVPFVLSAWRGHSTEPATMLSVGLGVLGLGALVVVVLVPSRIRTLTRAFGVDRIMGLHRWLGMLALAAVVAHAAVALWNHPALINPVTARATAKVGWGSLVALLAVGGVAAGGRRPGARYEVWARLHVALAAAGLVLAGLHVLWLNHLVADPVMRVCLVVLAAALLLVLSHRWVWRPLFSRQGAYVVYGVRREGPSVVTLVLAPVHLRRGGLHFEPGQFVWLRLRRAVVGTEEHPFTIASSANVTGRLELTVRDQGDFSHRVAALTQGQQVWLDGPHGSFTAEDHGGRAGLVLVAGGVGITPMMSMLRTLAERGDVRRHRLVLAERGSEPLFAPELEVLRRRLDLEVTRLAGRRIDVALLAEVLPPSPEREHLDYFVCGPASLATGTLAALEQLDVPPARVHCEQFGWSGPLPTTTTPGTSVPVDPAPPKDPHVTSHGPAAHPAVGGRRPALDPARPRGGTGVGVLADERRPDVGIDELAARTGPLPALAPDLGDHRPVASGGRDDRRRRVGQHDRHVRDDGRPRRRRGGRHASV
ncbi:ferric reductase-like transmembrane domain-containing protein [Actinomycetospora corticicola]|uniref:Putative ferric reductase n=1 Tax=Actinomycetospora corticicola TaxID=663602 RepID=A0A7Y9J7W4_9PSEU|nr:putative ferric reductase [Actinomycetospora corticicola]